MQTLREFKPTSYDRSGATFASLLDQLDWLVLPVTRNRDSGLLPQSNWACVDSSLENLEEWEIVRFSHWACGWFEIIIVKPNSKAHQLASEIAERLENYPVLDEDDYSNRELEATYSNIDD